MERIVREIPEELLSRLAAAVVMLEAYAAANAEYPEVSNDLSYGAISIKHCLAMLVGETLSSQLVDAVRQQADMAANDISETT